jgi:hypothetical protein
MNDILQHAPPEENKVRYLPKKKEGKKKIKKNQKQ